MKNIIKIIILVLCFSATFVIPNSYTFATEIQVKVTEKVPGANCGEPDKEGIVICTVEAGFGSVIKMLQAITRWFAFIAMLGGVLFIVINGILYSMGGNKDEVKKRIIQTLLGIIVLLLAGVILHLVAPWVYIS